MIDKGLGQSHTRKAHSKTVKGDEVAAQAMFNMFKIYAASQPQKNSGAEEDEVGIALKEVMDTAFAGKRVNLGPYGYTIKKSKATGATFIAVRNEAPE